MAKTTLRTKNTARGLPIPEFKTYQKVTLISTMLLAQDEHVHPWTRGNTQK